MTDMTVRAEIPALDLDNLDILDALIDQLDAHPRVTDPTCRPAPRRPAGGRPPRTEVVMTIDATDHADAATVALQALHGHDVQTLEVLYAGEYDDQGPARWPDVWSTAKVAKVLGITDAGVRYLASEGTLVPFHASLRAPLYDPREVLAYAAQRTPAGATR